LDGLVQLGKKIASDPEAPGMRRLIFAVLTAACIAAPFSHVKSPRQVQAHQSQEADQAIQRVMGTI
jgi:hypothetical protein